MESRKCPTCGARWIEGQHYWATGAKGNELDLAGLVCNKVPDEKPCVNPCRGKEGGATWEKRNAEVNSVLRRLEES